MDWFRDMSMNPWATLVQLSPEQVESLVEKVYSEHAQAFKPVSVDMAKGEVEVELKNGRRVKVKI